MTGPVKAQHCQAGWSRGSSAPQGDGGFVVRGQACGTDLLDALQPTIPCYIYIYVYIYLYTYVQSLLCIYIYIYLLIYLSSYLSIYAYMYIFTFACVRWSILLGHVREYPQKIWPQIWYSTVPSYQWVLKFPLIFLGLSRFP